MGGIDGIMGNFTINRACIVVLFWLLICAFGLADIQAEESGIVLSVEAIEGTDTLVTVLSNSSSQNYGDIDGDILVYTDDSTGSGNIVSFNLSTGLEMRLPPIPGFSSQGNPALWGDRIVFECQGEDSATYAIYLFNVTSGALEEIAVSSVSMPSSPDISGGKIVWQEMNGSHSDIFLFDLSSREKTLITPSTIDSDEILPVISGDTIVWVGMDSQNATSDIYLYDISSDHQVCLTPETYNTSQTMPAIDRDYVAWVEYDPLNTAGDVFLYSISNTTTQDITPETDGVTNSVPSVSGNRIVWQMSDLASWKSDICIHDVSSGITAILTQNTPDSDQYNPVINGDRIIWEQVDPEYWTYDIYLFTIGEELSPLEADFRVNVTRGAPPLAVQFEDNSSGIMTGQFWEFGDGNSSVEANPLYVYRDPGSYTVSYIVGNPKQRSAIRKPDIINVGSPPLISFISDKREGIHPLTVYFYDQSIHEPVSWNWSFGDGNYSSEQNPVHIYEVPGEYAVTLNASNEFGNTIFVETGYIHVLEGSVSTLDFSVPGISVNPQGSDNEIFIDTTMYPNVCGQNGTNITISPGTGILQMILVPEIHTAFGCSGGNTTRGNISRMVVKSQESLLDKGINASVTYEIVLPSYPPTGRVITEIWENATPIDSSSFRTTAITAGNFNDLVDVAYTTAFRRENITSDIHGSFVFGVDADWIQAHGWRYDHEIISEPPGAGVYVDSKLVGNTPLILGEGLSPGNHTVTIVRTGYYSNITRITLDDKRDSIHVIRIADDGTGEVLNTTFIGHDTDRNLDLFRAESPNGLSTFGLASLSKSGNFFQIIQMMATRALAPSGGGGGGGGNDGGSTPTSSATVTATSAPTPAATLRATTIPTQAPGPASETILTPGIQPEPPAVIGGAVAPEGATQNSSPLQFFTTGTSSIVVLKNFSIVFVVVFVTIVFYYRWKRQED